MCLLDQPGKWAGENFIKRESQGRRMRRPGCGPWAAGREALEIVATHGAIVNYGQQGKRKKYCVR